MPTPLKILYVEDNALVREVTAELLAQEQRQIVACADAEAALGEFRGDSFDVVITDVSLPVMSGIELARTLLRIKPHLPIIIASGYSLDFGSKTGAPTFAPSSSHSREREIEALISDLIAR